MKTSVYPADVAFRYAHKNAHGMDNGHHVFHRQKCIACGNARLHAPRRPWFYMEKEMTVEEVMSVILEDKEFYGISGGGVTLSGGECLMQADFCAKLLKSIKAHTINTAVDTCGFISKETLDKIMPYTDIFLYDIKAYDDDVHIKCTGQSNKLILQNLRYLNSCGKDIEIRIPYVPDFNSGQIKKIAEYLADLKNIKKVKILSYHNYSTSKYGALGMKNTLPAVTPSEESIKAAESLFLNLDIRNNKI